MTPACAPGESEGAMSELIDTFIARGDLAHLALLLWACGASAALWFVLRELAAASRRFDDFVRELQLYNRRAGRRAQRRGEQGAIDHH
jgi:hypothetical protein